MSWVTNCPKKVYAAGSPSLSRCDRSNNLSAISAIASTCAVRWPDPGGRHGPNPVRRPYTLDGPWRLANSELARMMLLLSISHPGNPERLDQRIRMRPRDVEPARRGGDVPPALVERSRE